MSKSTISTFQLFERFADQNSARVYLESLLWPNGAKCPVCGLGERITARRNGYYRCNQCKEDFTVRTGTIFERSHIPLHKWIYAMYLVVTARKGVSSMQLAKEIGITQKSAWFMLGRLREACGGSYPQLSGIVQIDETYIGGLEENKHESKRKHAGRGAVGKAAVVAMRDESGKTVAAPIVYGVNKAWMHYRIAKTAVPRSTIYTDESRVYSGLKAMSYKHEAVHHKSGEYVRDGVTTNSVESVFALLNRGIHGVYHHVSKKHLDRYVDEFTFRLNEGNVKRHTLERLESFVDGVAGKRLTYKDLIQ